MNAVVVFLLALIVGVVLMGSKRWALLALICGAIYLPQSNAVEIGGFNLFPTRFLELAAFLRVVCRRELQESRKVDRAMLWLYAYTTVIFVVRSSVGQAYAIGAAVDMILCYFAFRGLVNDLDDFRWFLGAFAVVLVPFTLMVVFHRYTWFNPFTWVGGETGAGWERNGHPRCFGSFRQPDLLGMFAASFLPLFVGLACTRTGRRRGLLGVGLCLVIAWTANSGGAASAAGVGLFGWIFWRLRTEMRKVRWGIVAIIALFALVMNAPVWFIFAHLSSITGGGGYHRSYLIEAAFRDLGEWWLWGMPIANTKDWFAYTLGNTDQADITNLYLSFGLGSGVLAIALFIRLLKQAFSLLGQALAVVRSSPTGTTEAECLLWGLGVMLVVHIVDWFGITYFDQMYLIWAMQLATVVSLASRQLAVCTETASVAEEAHGAATAWHGSACVYRA